MSFINPPKPFLETNAWQHGQNNSLRYNTSQAGSVLPLGYGKFRQQVNLIGFGDYRGPAGKKGKNGPLPIQGQNVGKGGGGGGKKGPGGKKSADFSIDIAFALCQGPVDIEDTNQVWSSAGIAFFQSVGLNEYDGTYGQAADPTFVGLGQVVAYSGTCYVTGTPMDLGQSPVIPNLSFEITGFETGTVGPGYTDDANAANIVLDFLTNPEHGAEFPSANIDPDIATTYGDYCQAAQLAMSPVLQVQTEAASWINELARLTNTAIVWSGAFLKFIPYGDLELDSNGATWTPNLTPEYSVNDNDFLPWNPHLDTADPILNDDDPVIVTRSNPADAINWVSMEYLDRGNSYNKNIVAQFDQGSIDLYGLRTEASIQGNCFCNATSASISARLILQRHLYIRNIYKFQLGWRFVLLEPMDIILITDINLGLVEQPVRIISIDENENGDFVFEAEEIAVGTTASPGPTPPPTDFSPDGGMDGITFATSVLNPLPAQPDNWQILSIASDSPGNPWGGVDDTFHDLVYVFETTNPSSINKWTLDVFTIILDGSVISDSYSVSLALANWETFEIYSESSAGTLNPGGSLTLTCPTLSLQDVGTGLSTIFPYVVPGLGLTPILIIQDYSISHTGNDIRVSDGHLKITRYGNLV